MCPFPLVEEFVRPGPVVENGPREVGEFQFVTTHVVPQRGESAVHVDAEAFGEHSFGLLDEYPAVERCLKLFGENVPLPEGALLEQSDGGDVDERLGRAPTTSSRSFIGRASTASKPASAAETTNVGQVVPAVLS